MEHYLLLTPGPLTTSPTVKQAMLKDWCTWDDDYNVAIVEQIRSRLVELAGASEHYSSVLMQGSGTAAVESVIGSALKSNDKLLIINNGAYGARMVQIAQYLKIDHIELSFTETEMPCLQTIANCLMQNANITHIAMVHCETTTGMLNPAQAVCQLAKQYQKVMILDAMSSFGGMPIDVEGLDIGFLISSANKCIQGVPGFGFVIAKRELLQQCQGIARSLSLDLFDQWQTMEASKGKWRFTSPTHVVRAFYQALIELDDEGGITKRHQRYQQNQTTLVKGMRELGFRTLLDDSLHSPIITSFYSPLAQDYQFKAFYQKLKAQGFVIYPGKVSNADCFRIGNIGEVYPQDIERLLQAIATAKYW